MHTNNYVLVRLVITKYEIAPYETAPPSWFILSLYGQPCHDECNGKDYWHYIHLALYSFGTCAVSTDEFEDRLRVMRLARKMPLKIHF